METITKVPFLGSRLKFVKLLGKSEPCPYIAVDLDGTLAEYDGFKGHEHIGAPIPAMVERVKVWLAEGKQVKIFTARVADDFTGDVKRRIQAWCLEHIGAALPVTNAKDSNMIELWDDRARQVETNTGELVRKFNPNHDEKGEFTSDGGSGGAAAHEKGEWVSSGDKPEAVIAVAEAYVNAYGTKPVSERVVGVGKPLRDVLRDPEMTQGQCYTVTTDFVRWGKANYPEHKYATLQGETADSTTERPSFHFAVKVDGKYAVDLTSKQFHASNSVIRVSTVKDWQRDYPLINKTVHTPLRKRMLPVIQAQANMEAAIAKFLRKTGDNLAAKVRGAAKAVSGEWGFGEGYPGIPIWLQKADQPDAKTLLKKLLPIDWSPLLDEIEPYMDEIAEYGATEALSGLGITDSNLITAVNEAAGDWAAMRAAEMVGMKRVAGKLIENPDAKWAISETTRDAITELVTNAFEERTSIPELASAIQEAGIFSASRAKMIAQTEGARAQAQGNITGWKGSGVVKSLQWQLSNDHDIDDICDELADGGPYELSDVPECPAHPNCFCILAVAELLE